MLMGRERLMAISRIKESTVITATEWLAHQRSKLMRVRGQGANRMTTSSHQMECHCMSCP
uniref:Uncharacterized protein n=1 Tax=Arundo donax TaxID=35708 RepID=A0A0A9ETV0_ARUDO